MARERFRHLTAGEIRTFIRERASIKDAIAASRYEDYPPKGRFLSPELYLLYYWLPNQSLPEETSINSLRRGLCAWCGIERDTDNPDSPLTKDELIELGVAVASSPGGWDASSSL